MFNLFHIYINIFIGENKKKILPKTYTKYISYNYN